MGGQLSEGQLSGVNCRGVNCRVTDPNNTHLSPDLQNLKHSSFKTHLPSRTDGNGATIAQTDLGDGSLKQTITCPANSDQARFELVTREYYYYTFS